MGEDNLKIIVACHKSDPLIRQGEFYLPVQVGKALVDIDLGFQNDDVGDNISAKNKSYCELTALYWAWKNLRGADYIGLAHYRRYLATDYSKYKLQDLFKDIDIMIPRPRVLTTSNLAHLQSLLSAEDVCIMLDSILELYPEMRQSVLDYFYNSNRYTLFNMFVTTRENFDAYCTFLFPLLEHIEHRLASHSYSRQTRVIGYMAEAILGLWIRHNHLRVAPEECILNGVKAVDKSKKWLRDYKNTLAFRLAKTKNTREPTFYSAIINGLKADGIEISHLNSAD